ncbi:hypothetical protein TB1_010843 [Malus domestica]
MEFSVKQFNGKGSFTLWQMRVKDVLTQQGLARALKGKDGKPKEMTDDQWEELESRCVSTIQHCIADNIINNVMDEDYAPALWEKLEKLYIAKNSYENLVTTLLHGKDTVSLEQVQASLVSYDTQKKKTIVDGGHETALAVQGWNRGRKLGEGSKRDNRGFAAGGAIGFTGDQMVLRKGSVRILSGSTSVAGNGRADEFPGCRQ